MISDVEGVCMGSGDGLGSLVELLGGCKGVVG